jgi:hypothetical protein
MLARKKNLIQSRGRGEHFSDKYVCPEMADWFCLGFVDGFIKPPMSGFHTPPG